MTLKSKAQSILHKIQTTNQRMRFENDPVSLVHRYLNPLDQEIVAFIAALLAFGNAKAIRGSLEPILKLLGASPYKTLRNGIVPEKIRVLPGHRWIKPLHLSVLFKMLEGVYARFGSLERLFMQDNSDTLAKKMDHFSKTLRSLSKHHSRGMNFLLPFPSSGSACKRLNMFLRWMVRPADGIDLGLWKGISPAQLIIPLDVHVYKFGRRFRLSRYKTPNWKFAQEVTDFLKTLSPDDPVKYDFAICHYGMEVGW